MKIRSHRELKVYILSFDTAMQKYLKIFLKKRRIL